MREEASAAAAEATAAKVREAFAVLSQGVELTLYNTRLGARGAQVLRQLVWIDSDILRICVDTMRPTLVDRALGRVAPGLYMRDISEVREGDNALDFKMSPTPPLDRDKCLSLIGSERSLCLEMPSKFARDWFLLRFRCVLNDVLSDEEKRSRIYSQHQTSPERLPPAELESAEHLQGMLQRGVQLLSHHPSGLVLKAVLTFDPQQQALVLTPTERGGGLLGLLAPPKAPVVVLVLDVSEVRCGSHSLGFVRTLSTDKGAECLSVVSSGQSMDLQVQSAAARDILVDKLRLFCRKLRVSREPSSGAGAGGRGGKPATAAATGSDFDFARQGQASSGGGRYQNPLQAKR